MCSHSQHRVEVPPDGQVDETHIHLEGELAAWFSSLRPELQQKVLRNAFGEEVPNG
jgi:hypothetical protein